ncbi:MAG: VWA domain-containing protein [Acidobacteria bacterium]|nr:VWA domain-containing protein [Acidobacteriota bacterium]
MKPLMFVLCLSLLDAQQPVPTVKFSVTSQLVVVNVSVRDRSGRPIEGLQAKDFTILEDDKPQKISVFEHQQLESEPEPAPAPRPAMAADRAPRITPSTPGQVRFKDRRLLVLFFDFSSMPPEDQLRAQKSAVDFLDRQITPSDVVALMSFTSRLQVLQDFTQDRDRLKEIIQSFRIGETSELAEEAPAGEDEDGIDTGAAFTADETEFNIFNTDRKLTALESAVRMLTSLPEKKALVYFSSGVGQTGTENQAQLRSTVNAAIRGNVSFYPIDARGLVASAPGGDASQGSARGTGIFSGQSQRQRRERFNNQQETLFTLAADTGGKALLDSNDLSLGIVQAQKDISSYYILAYYSANPAQDGRYRRIKVRLESQPQAKLDFRSGYFASKQFRDFNATDKERQLEEALLLGDPFTDLTLALELDWFRLARDRYFIPLSVKIPGSQIELARKKGVEETELEFIGQVRDGQGRLAATVRDAIKVKLRGGTAGKLSQRSLYYDTGFTLPPGSYTLKFLARENETGKLGTFETKFAIPDLAAQTSYLRLSSVVWASQREPLSAAVGVAERNRRRLATHPLVKDGRKLVPSITKVFRKDQNLFVYLEVYDAATDPARKSLNLAATVSFFKGQVKAFESEPLRVTQPPAGRLQSAPLEFQVPLAKLQPGDYTCQVNVVDQTGTRFAFARSPLVLLPQ